MLSFARETTDEIMDTQQARTILNFMTQVWEGEYAATCKVLAAV
ncbi:MAG: hypothetical protein ACKOEC_21885 [Acidimicrobiia bacterium]